MQKSFLSLFIMVIVLLFATGCAKKEPLVLQGQTMGTTYHIKIVDSAFDSSGKQALQLAVDSVLKEMNRQMSTYIPESEISRFNRWPAHKPFRISRDFMNVLKLSLQIYKESQGAFDVTVGPLVDLWGFGKKGRRTTPPTPDQIQETLKRVGSEHIHILNDTLILKDVPGLELDFSAVAKGYGVDAVAALLGNRQFKNFMVEIGGEVVVKGTKNEKPWRIGVDRPSPNLAPGEQLEAILKLSDLALATSGDYRNYFTYHDSLYSHEIHPKTGRPVRNHVASVTVLAPSCALADAMATAIMVMGAQKGLAWVESKPQAEAMIILRKNGKFEEALSSGFNRYLEN